MNTGLEKMFGQIKPGMCRLSMNGIAIKTNNEYKVYDVETGNLTNCDDFVFDIGEDFFFLIPTNSVQRGDIILVSGKPNCVVSVNEKAIEAFNYENSSIIQLVPEKHIMFGNTYFYSKIVSMFGTGANLSSESIMPMMMFNQMSKNGGESSELGKMMMMSAMMKGNFGFDNILGDAFSAKKTEPKPKVEEKPEIDLDELADKILGKLTKLEKGEKE